MKLNYDNAVSNFSETFHLSKKETSKGNEYIPGGFSRKTFGYGPHAVFVSHGEGQYIHTIDGQRLLDLNNNFSTNVLGHNHSAVVNSINEVISKGFSFGNPMDYEIELAKILCDRVSSIEQVKFFCSASEACLGAIRIARGYTGKNKIAKFEGGYHGFTDDLAVSAHPNTSNFPGPSNRPKPIPDSGGIPEFKTENIIILTQNDLSSCERILRDNAASTACLIMELQSGAGGIVELTPEFVKGIREITSQLGIVLIFDETITFRASVGGLQSVYDVAPDMTVLGKMIGGGLPIGAVGGTKEIFNVLNTNQVSISGTHHGHPLACAAGIATMQLMDESAHLRLNTMAEKIKHQLNSWAAKNGYPFIMFGAFSVLGYAFTKTTGQTITTHRDYWQCIDENAMSIYALEMATRGYYPVHRGQIGLTLPMTDDDIDGYIDATKDIISTIF